MYISIPLLGQHVLPIRVVFACLQMIRLCIMHGGSPVQTCQPGIYFTQHDKRRFLINLYCYPHWDLIVRHSWDAYFATEDHSLQYRTVYQPTKLVKVLIQ